VSILDELRESVAVAYIRDRSFSDRIIDDLFDAFEAAHPGLVDGTWTCSCGSVWRQYRALFQDGSGFTTCSACAPATASGTTP